MLRPLFEEHKKLLTYSSIIRLANGAFNLGGLANREYIDNYPLLKLLFRRSMPNKDLYERL